MAPTESQILRDYLLLPSQLPSVISPVDFAALFPRSQQALPQVRSLYRDLRRQRNAIEDVVKANIDKEVKRGKALRKETLQEKLDTDMQDVDEEIEIERTVRAECVAASEPVTNTECSYSEMASNHEMT